MRNLLTLLVVVGAAAASARADSLYLNPAQAPIPEAPLPQTQTAVVGHPAAHTAGHACPTCRTHGAHHGSLGQYPGGCCERDAQCCASLWANYCQEKKPCWTPESPRRHADVDGFGIPMPSLPSLSMPKLPCGWFGKRCHSVDAPCDLRLNCDTVQSDLSVTAPAVDAAPGFEVLDGAGDVQQPVPPDLETPSARRKSSPFGWKLPSPADLNPFKDRPTARKKSPFSR
jgi:hypothetical protein